MTIRHHALRILVALLTLLIASALVPAASRAQPSGRIERAELDLAADRTAYAQGGTARIAAIVTIEEGWHVNAHVPTFDYLIPTELTLDLPADWPAAEIVYPEPELATFAFADLPLAVYDGRTVILASLAVPASAAPGRVSVRGTLRYQACNDRSCLPPVTTTLPLELTIAPPGGGGATVNPELFAAGPLTGGGADGEKRAAVAAGTGGSSPPAAGGRLPLMLALALLGGLILNAMPCVLPVLSLKVFGLVKSAGQGRRQVVVGSLATAAGILASFTGLALAAVGAKAAGAAVGWGIQFQRPGFVTFLAIVVVLFCLNLWGLFEISLPYRLANAIGGGAGQREGVAGHFASGLFATLMATPCSAPFLGTAVGFALAQNAGTILAIFTAVGVGMALPYLVLAVAPGAASLLPRPGAWMETLKITMGFLLAGAAIWLFYVLSAQVTPERLAAIELGLLALALFVWLRSRGATGRTVRAAALAGVAAAVVATLALAVTAGAAATPAAGGTPAPATAGGGIPWIPFDRDRAEALAAEGSLVFVDVTADWCFTCKANERLVLETDETARLFADHGVVAMKADWTNRDDSIAAFLADYGRYSIPFYLLYRPGAEPHLFSELLTKDQIGEIVRAASAGKVARR